MPYLFTHFREKLTVDGEQVHFAVSRDGFHWEMLNGGKPVLTCTKGEGGCRDIEIVRLKTGGFVLLATDACLLRYMDDRYRVDWNCLRRTGSKCLSLWRTDDLVHFSPQELVYFGSDAFGCLWAPEVFYDELRDEYLIHWSSTVRDSDYGHMSIYCCTTKDFKTFSSPQLFFTKDNEILDSHLVKHENVYHLFYKNADCPAMNMHATATDVYGPYRHDSAFEAYMETLEKPGSYEAPTTFTLPDGSWCLMLDFFGCEKEKMGYVPFVSEKVGEAAFHMAKEAFTFPYGFKHGHAIEITDTEYDRLKRHYS